MDKVIKNEKGITLVALIVTIIVLMILAGITLKMVLGPNGLITKAKYAKTQTEISGEKEQLSMAIAGVTLDNTGTQATLDQMKDEIVSEGITTAENIKVGDDRLQVTTPKGHTYTIDQSGNVEYIGEGAVTVPDLTDANVAFTYTPSDWTNKNVQVVITTTVKGFALQYSNDGNTWNDDTSAIMASSNETIYARLWDGINYGGVATGNVTNIDKTNPTLILSQDSGTPTRKITINAIDTQSEINVIQYNNGGIWQSLATSNITNGKSATYQVTSNGTYTFRTVDNADNITSQSITVTGIITVASIKGGATISATTNTQIVDDNGNIVTIPAGFKIASDSATRQEDGIVIEDKDGNQFVWIPVTNISNYIRTDFKRYWTGYYYSNFLEIMPSDEKTSIDTYNGYYIGRYEAGDSVSTTNKILRTSETSITNPLTIKKGQAPYNCIMKDKANVLAIGMKTTEGYNAETKLCSSYAWDTAMNFMQNKVSNYGTSSNQGNYKDTTFSYTDITGATQTKPLNSTILVPTGETTSLCNIYDMGGNEWEWTTETCSNSNYPDVARGGGYDSTYSDCAAGCRDGIPINFSYYDVGFRVALYM